MVENMQDGCRAICAAVTSHQKLSLNEKSSRIDMDDTFSLSQQQPRQHRYPQSCCSPPHHAILTTQQSISDSKHSVDSDFYNPKICEGCDAVITDLYIVKVVSKTDWQQVVEKCWHERCLRCCMCRKAMTQTCFEKDGRYYCSEDYHGLFGDRCTVCHELIANMEMVMKPTPEHFCHLSCFRCVTCHRQLRTGDLYSVNPDHGWPYCQNHTMDAIPQRSHPFTAAAHHLQVLNSMGSNHADHDMYPSMTGGGMSCWSDDCLDDDLHSNNKNEKRPRTVLSSGQRRVLKTAFDLDPKPSKKARHVMAVETGLTNRVVQVWFQNQRAKIKKRRIASSGTGEDSGSEHQGKKICYLSTSGSSDNPADNNTDHQEAYSDTPTEKPVHSPSCSVSRAAADDLYDSDQEHGIKDYCGSDLTTSPSAADNFHNSHSSSKLLEINSPSLYPQYCF